MATVVEQGKRGSPARYDGIVEARLAKAQGRIRSLDTTTGLLAFAVLTVGYALVMSVLDRRFELSLGVRQLAFLLYAGCSLGILALFTFRPLVRRVNPYYAARHIEKQIPSAKNSVVNWIDLHAQDLPASIKGAVGQRAAHDLSKVNLEEAFQGRHTVWLGVSTLGLGLALFILLVLFGLPQFLSLLRRAFIPYEGGIIAKQTQIIVKTGDTTIPVEQPATILVEVLRKEPDPRQPDALRLLLRYRETDPYEDPILLDKVDVDRRDWQAIVPASRVRNGFWYKVKGGDDESQEYRVGVRSSPLIKGFEAKLHYPKYMGWTDKGTFDPNLREMAGTEVTLIVHTNRAVRKGSLELDLDKERKSLAAAPLKDDPQAMLFHFVLEKSGTYGVRFTSSEGEEYSDSMRYSLTAIQDRAPNVKLNEPGQDVTLPSNGTLPLKGQADDDIGLTQITLRLQVEGAALEAKPYREGKDFKLSDGSYPKMLEYEDFIGLGELKDAQGNKAVIAEGKTIEYWLEAEDNYEPKHHVGESKRFKITLAPPSKETQKQQQQREKAEQDKKEHEKKQDKDLKQEGEKRKQGAQGSQGDTGKPDADKPDGKKPDSQPNQEGTGEQKPDNQQTRGGSQGASQAKDETKQTEDSLNKAAQGDQPGEKGKGESEGQPKADAKGDPANQPKADAKGQGKEEKSTPKGDAKDSSGKGEPNQANPREKNEGNPNSGGAQDKAGAKAEGRPQPSESKGESKEQKGEKSDNASAKGDGRPEANPAQGTEKGAGQGDPKEQAAAKNEGAKPDAQNQPGAAKDGKGEKADGKPEAIAKGQSPATEKADKKDGGANNGGTQEEAKAEGKDDKQGGGGEPRAEEKPTKEGGPARTGTAKDDKPTEQEKADLAAQIKKDNQGAKPEDVSKLEKEAQGADGQKERELIEKLSQIKQNADDPAAKDAADKALDKMLDKMAERPSDPGKAKPAPEKKNTPENKNENPGTPKEGPGKNNPETGSAKSDPSDKKNDQKGSSKNAGDPTKPSEPNEPNKKPGDPSNPADAQAKDRGEPDKNPKTAKPGTGKPDEPLANQNPSKPLEGGEGDPENLKKASQLQLESIRKLIKEHPEILDKAGLSTDDLGRYFEAKQKQIADYDRMAREKAEAAAKNQEPAGKTTGSFTNIGAQKLKPDDAKAGNANTPGAGAPPPEFRDMYYKKFTKPRPNP